MILDHTLFDKNPLRAIPSIYLHRVICRIDLIDHEAVGKFRSLEQEVGLLGLDLSSRAVEVAYDAGVLGRFRSEHGIVECAVDVVGFQVEAFEGRV